MVRPMREKCESVESQTLALLPEHDPTHAVHRDNDDDTHCGPARVNTNDSEIRAGLCGRIESEASLAQSRP